MLSPQDISADYTDVNLLPRLSLKIYLQFLFNRRTYHDKFNFNFSARKLIKTLILQSNTEKKM